jgi:hypothetical protein
VISAIGSAPDDVKETRNSDRSCERIADDKVNGEDPGVWVAAVSNIGGNSTENAASNGRSEESNVITDNLLAVVAFMGVNRPLIVQPKFEF